MLKAQKLANLMHNSITPLLKKAMEGMFSKREFLNLANEFLTRQLENPEADFSLFMLPGKKHTEQDIATKIVEHQDLQDKCQKALNGKFDATLAYSFMDWLSREKNISLDENSPDAATAARAFLMKAIPAINIVINRLNGDYNNVLGLTKVEKTPDRPMQRTPATTMQKEQNSRSGWITEIKSEPEKQPEAIPHEQGNRTSNWVTESKDKIKTQDKQQSESIPHEQGNRISNWITETKSKGQLQAEQQLEENSQSATQAVPIVPIVPIAPIVPIIPVIPQVTTEQQPLSNTIGKLMDMYIEQRIADKRWRVNTEIDFRSHINLFLEYFGNSTPITSIKRQHLIEYRENVLKRLPKNRVLNKAVKDLPLAEQLADETVEKISIATLNLYIGTINSFFNWCVISDFITKNPCSSLQLPDPHEGEKRKNSYSSDDIKRIINALAALPQKGENGVKNIERTWIVLLGMYQGMRENEICQLFIDNVVIWGSIPCLHLTRSDKETQSIKNESSFRTLPIHPALLSHGFLDFVNQRRCERDAIMRKRTSTSKDKLTARQLFQTMTHDPRRNNYTKNFLNFFSKFNREIIPDTKKTFHSFRHCFDSYIKNRSKIPFAVKYLCGHSSGKIDRAYDEADMQVLLPEISMVDYGFDVFATLRKESLTAEQIAEQAKTLPIKEI